METSALDGGFATPPQDAARAFRAALEAMARPGTRHQITGAAPPNGLSLAAGTLLLTLADTETPVHLAGAADTPFVRDWLTFHTGAPFVPPKDAMFAVGSWEALLPLDQYPIGEQDYPDRSATLIVEMEALTGQGVTLSGPGIKDTASLSLPDAKAMAANAALYPLGLDFYLCAGDQIAGLPRSTRIGRAG